MSDNFYKQIDTQIEKENINRIFNDRPDDLHDYQGCENDPVHLRQRISNLELEVREWKDKPARTLPRLVVCAIIIRDGKVLLERRAPAGVEGLDGKWDLPGGKVECGEEPHEAITREIQEELNIRVLPAKMIPYLPISTWNYPDGEQRHWILAAYRCDIVSGDPVVTPTLQWFDLEELSTIDILPSDLQLVQLAKQFPYAKQETK